MENKNSLGVKVWRAKTKQRIVEAFGGACGICGYKKCNDALTLHHLDPSKKEFGIGQIRAKIVSWKRIVAELRKCVMICENCHREVHAGVTAIPKNIRSFNEEYSDYKKRQNKNHFDTCPICGGTKEITAFTCSKQCAAKRAYTVDWENFDLKHHLVDLKMSYVKIGDLLGISDASVRKRAKKHGLSSVYEKSA